MAGTARRVQTAAVSAAEFLNVSNFRLTVPEYQRNYQWEQRHVARLLGDLHALLEPSKGDTFYLLGNIVLLATNAQQLLAAASSELLKLDWWQRDARGAWECDIVDGQQRLTTLTMLYACIHAAICKAKDDCQETNKATAKKMENLASDLRKRFLNCTLCVFTPKLTQREEFNNKFAFQCAKENRLSADPSDKKKSILKEVKNCNKIINWLKDWQQKGKKDKGDQAKVDLEKLQGLLTVLDHRVGFTVMLAFEAHQAFKMFANINYLGKPLTAADVLKATLVEGQKDASNSSVLVSRWNNSLGSLADLTESLNDVNTDDLRHESLSAAWHCIYHRNVTKNVLGFSEAIPNLFDDLLLYIRIIKELDYTYDQSRDAMTQSVEYFSSKFGQDGTDAAGSGGIQNDPKDFLDTWLEPYTEHLRYLLQDPKMLSPLGYQAEKKAKEREQARDALRDIRERIYCLLCFPDKPPDWRPVVLLAINTLSWKGNAGIYALQAFISELEQVTLYMLLNPPPLQKAKTRQDIYCNIMKSLTKLHADTSNLTVAATKAVRDAWTKLKVREEDSATALLRELEKPLYVSGQAGKAKAVLMLLEHTMHAHSNTRFSWLGPCTVEHILPQNPHRDWTEPANEDSSKPGWSVKEDRDKCTHRLGNLCLLNAAHNQAVGNLPYDEKIQYLKELGNGSITASRTAGQLQEYTTWNKAAYLHRTTELLDLLFNKRWKRDIDIKANVDGPSPRGPIASQAPLPEDGDGPDESDEDDEERPTLADALGISSEELQADDGASPCVPAAKSVAYKLKAIGIEAEHALGVRRKAEKVKELTLHVGQPLYFGTTCEGIQADRQLILQHDDIEPIHGTIELVTIGNSLKPNIKPYVTKGGKSTVLRGKTLKARTATKPVTRLGFKLDDGHLFALGALLLAAEIACM